MAGSLESCKPHKRRKFKKMKKVKKVRKRVLRDVNDPESVTARFRGGQPEGLPFLVFQGASNFFDGRVIRLSSENHQIC